MGTIKTIGNSDDMACVVGESVIINKYVIFGLNALWMLIFAVRNFSVAGLITFIVAMVYAYFLIFKSSKDEPAVVDLPVLVFADFAVYIGVRLSELKEMVSSDGIIFFFSDVHAMFWILFLAGLAIGILGLLNKRLIWLTGFAGCLTGSSFIFLGWSNGDIENLYFINSGASLLALFVFAAIAWTIFLYLIVKTVPDKANRTVWIGITILVMFIILLVFGTDYVNVYLLSWNSPLLKWPVTFFAWWKVILVSIILFIGIFVLYRINGENGSHLSIDTYALIIAGELLLTVRILMSWYFTHNWIILAMVIIGTYQCMRNDYRGRKTLRLSSITYLAVQYGVAIVLIILLKNGLWINAVVSLAFSIAFYVESGRPKKASYLTTHWLMILACIVAETAAWLWRNRFAVDTMIILVVILVFGSLTILAINMKRPGGRLSPDLFRIAICVCVAILCLAIMTRYGVSVKHSVDESSGVVNIALSARGKNNSIKSAYCYWRDGIGKIQSEKIELKGTECHIMIEDEVLTVVAEDNHGVVTSKVLWYPHLFDSFIE